MRPALTQCPAAPAAITIRWRVATAVIYPGQYGGIVRTGAAVCWNLPVRWPVNPDTQLRDTQYSGRRRLVVVPAGNKGACAIRRPNSASLDLSKLPSSLPRRRWSSQILLIGGELGPAPHFLA
ncbi:hypothetical protein KCP73_26115 [Salmonella enterica subsp. enterica]|nr:hypothetical protein KCP73_26115 [Salmonella enterica subsp. enterica]